MTDQNPDRIRGLGRHLRRHGIAYAALAVAFSFSPVPSMAAELIGTADIENGAVTAPKLAANSVNSPKIADETVTRNDIRNDTIGGDDIADLEWHPLDLVNGWADVDGDIRPAAWAIDAQGVMHLRGAITGGVNAPFARIPAPVRPPVDISVVTTLVDAKPGRIVIRGGGYLVADYDDSFQDAIDFTSLDGVTWAR